MTGYLPLAEAAQYVTNKTGKECEPDALLRAGVHGALLIAAAFSGQMRNLTAHKNEDYSGLLTIHPRHLFEIETDGQATIVEALSLEGSARYAPHKIRTREQLRVLVSELDRFIPYIVEITPQHQAAPTGAPESNEIANFADIPDKLPIISIGQKIRTRNRQLKKENAPIRLKTLANEFHRSISTIKKHLYGPQAKKRSSVVG